MIDSLNYMFSSYQVLNNCRPDKGWVTVAGIRCQLFKSIWFFLQNIDSTFVLVISNWSKLLLCATPKCLDSNEIWSRNLGLSSNIHLSPRADLLPCHLTVSKMKYTKSRLHTFSHSAILHENRLLCMIVVNVNKSWHMYIQLLIVTAFRHRNNWNPHHQFIHTKNEICMTYI